MRTFSAPREGRGLRVAVVVARFNHLVCVRLLEGCVRELSERGGVWAPAGGISVKPVIRTR